MAQGLFHIALCLILKEYEGVYVYTSTELEIKSENNQLLLSSGGGSPAAVLAYKEPLRFQVNSSDSSYSLSLSKSTRGKGLCKVNLNTFRDK